MGWVVNATPRPLYPWERPGWVGLCGGVDECGISRPHGDSIYGPSSPKWFVIPSTLFRPNCEILLHLTFHEDMLPDSLQVRRTQIQWRCGNEASLTDVTYLSGWKKLLSLKSARKIHVNRGADKSLARPGRKQANVSVRMALISFGSLPCRGKKKNLDESSRLHVVEIAHVPDMLPSLFPSWSG